MALPPAHRIDHTPILVLTQDSAWDMERIQYELDVLAEKIEADPSRPVNYESTNDHPYLRYVGGTARCDLGTVESYLRDEFAPVKFALCRLDLKRWGRVQDLINRGEVSEAYMCAIRYGLTDVSGVEIKLSRNGTGGALGSADLERLRSLVGDEGMVDLGTNIISVSRSLLEAEKKPSASGPGN